MKHTSDVTVFERLRALKADCGANKHDQAVALISACILEGLDTGPRIVGALTAIGMNPNHIRIMLRELTGASPDCHCWRRDGEGRHSLHEEEPVG